ncbi:MAG: hypothetical protein AAF747_09550 [Planctomycetota bacterium]
MCKHTPAEHDHETILELDREPDRLVKTLNDPPEPNPVEGEPHWKPTGMSVALSISGVALLLAITMSVVVALIGSPTAALVAIPLALIIWALGSLPVLAAAWSRHVDAVRNPETRSDIAPRIEQRHEVDLSAAG